MSGPLYAYPTHFGIPPENRAPLNGWTPPVDQDAREHCPEHGRWTRLGQTTRKCPECPQ